MSLKLSGNEVDTVFALNGVDENSATCAFGYVLSRSPALLRAVIRDLAKIGIDPEQATIEVQKHEKDDKGGTDIEIHIPNSCDIIIESKRGWELPSEDQLEKYAARLKTGKVSNPLMVSLSAASQDYAESQQRPRIRDICLVHRSWKDLHRLVQRAHRSTTSKEEKRWLREFEIHLGGYVSMRNPRDNMVYMVVLSQRRINGDYTWIDIVYKDNRYFHPIGNKYPKKPPNYIGFRYGGQLRSVHHIDGYEAVNTPNLSSVNKNWRDLDLDTGGQYYFVYKLGPAMKPGKPIKNGSIWPNGRFECAIDTLLSGACKTISAAKKETDKRLESEGI